MNEQNNNNSYPNNLQPTKLSWASLVSVFIIGLISVGVGALTAHLTFEQSQFGKNQRAIKVSLLLAAYWENIFDSETSRKLLRTMDSSERNKIMKYLATPINKINVSEVKKDKAILSLLELDQNADNLKVINQTILYRSAIIKALNTIETIISNRKNYTESKLTNDIPDRPYKCTVEERYKQLEPFVIEYRKHQTKAAWEPIDRALKNGWGSPESCK